MYPFFVPMSFKRSEHVQPEDFVVTFWLEMLYLYLAWSTVFLDVVPYSKSHRNSRGPFANMFFESIVIYLAFSLGLATYGA